ncbi:hypothetical protein [Acinetobacter seifertii]|uniref:hypothetical protein n=1 Tax=Acinetobacter seifertii TaxID=1530123 RepID=UPI000C21E3E3|nr:hypothetical protein [Acinetobacter seifertii]PJG67813.1 hypothetical protein CVD09_03685 [Acinetobacter seifertii]
MNTDKYTFFKFIQEQEDKSHQRVLPSTRIEQGVSAAIGSLPLVALLGSNKKVEKFRQALTQDLQSNETLKDISSIVGTPIDGETEDDFVNRSIDKLRIYLKQKYK